MGPNSMTGIFPALTSALDEMAETGYSLRLACSCGAAFEQWVMPELSAHVAAQIPHTRPCD
jgi:hypothetical protein